MDSWNKENLKKLIDALRSGEFPQITGSLCDVTRDGEVKGYCCLGVASKISEVGNFDKTNGVFVDTEGDDWGSSVLTHEVQKWLGVGQGDPYIYFGEPFKLRNYVVYSRVSCTGMNDSWRLTFPQIADMLEYFVYNNLPDNEDAPGQE